MKKSVIYLLIFLIIILITLLLLRLSSNKQSTKNEPQPILTISESKTIKIINTSLTTENVGATDPITFSFPSAINTQSFSYQINLQTRIAVTWNAEKTQVTFYPKEGWNFDSQYTINISKQTTSTDGLHLDKDYLYNFKTYKYSGI